MQLREAKKMEMGHKIAQLRNKKKISQRQLAKDLNVSQGVVGLWETNKRYPTMEGFINIIDYFYVSADFLIEDDRTLNPTEYTYNKELSPEAKKLLNAFYSLNEDNKDILLGEVKKLLKEQRLEEKEISTIDKAT
jgi:transcriptional regulator with XRE-family HTH domain